MKRLLYIFSLVFFSSCLSEELAVVEEIVDEVPERPKTFNACSFEFSDNEGEFPFINTWEYAGFWDAELRHMDNGTCVGRWASYYFLGEDPENPPRMILEILPKSTDPNHQNCEQGLGFMANGLLSKAIGCYSINMQLFRIEIEGIEPYNPMASITLEEAYADQLFFDGLMGATHYEIQSNKLFVFTSADPTRRMVFLSVKD